MKRALIIAGAVAGLLFAAPAAGYASVVADDGSRITVFGEGRVSAHPDVMRLRAGVEAREPSASQAFAAVRAEAARLTQALLEAGVDEKDLTTTELSLGPEYDKTPAIVAFRAGQGVEAVVRDLANADRVIDVVASIGESVRFHGISFELSDPGAVLGAAREAAFRDAEAKAGQYATLSGRMLGPVMTISDEAGGSGPLPFGAVAMAADTASISPGTQTITATVRVVYKLASDEREHPV